LYLCFIPGFLYAFGIGANDVANAFGTTVASKSLTLRQAICVAAVFEFAGALLLGGSVTHTVRSDIFDTTLYEAEPDLVMLGFFTSLVSASLSLLVASRYGIPVSSTHTVSHHLSIVTLRKNDTGLKLLLIIFLHLHRTDCGLDHWFLRGHQRDEQY
jgi:phosphate/sulfate permease